MNSFLNYIPIYGMWRMYKNDFEHLPLMSSWHFNGTAFVHALYMFAAILLLGLYY